MWDKLIAVEEKFEELGRQLSSPDTIKDRAKFQKYSKEHKDLSELVAVFRSYKKAKEEFAGSQDLMNNSKDSDMVTMAKEESHLLSLEIEQLEKKLQLLLLPKDPNDEKNVVLEIRAGTGGDEASIFVGNLFEMYCRYADKYKWKVEIMSSSSGSMGGFKEIIAMINGFGAFSRLKYEKGIHRVQRVPDTEAQGRIHTSTVTVAVLPEAEDVEIDIQDKELRIDVFRAGGPGGQSVNTTDSAVRITHLPSGIVVSMQDEKSQTKNKQKAMKVLQARLLQKKQDEADALRSADRKSQVGTGERSGRIRTYNFPQSRVTDHRIGLTLYNLAQVMVGGTDDVIEPLIAHYQALALRGESPGMMMVDVDDDD
ncbi:MAG: peptide chain release factor 1 [bacterium]|nr:peptide chain release factor 1 [bacterium]